ncbi:hypothetical protein ACFL6F_02375 [Planctomycetota bacterium]
MILVAENDVKVREKLVELLHCNGYIAEGTAVDAQLQGFVDKIRPALLVAGVSLHKESEEFRFVKSLTESTVIQGIPLLLAVETVIPEKSGVRKMNIEQICCDSYCDKPIDVYEFIDKVRMFVHAVPVSAEEADDE